MRTIVVVQSTWKIIIIIRLVYLHEYWKFSWMQQRFFNKRVAFAHCLSRLLFCLFMFKPEVALSIRESWFKPDFVKLPDFFLCVQKSTNPKFNWFRNERFSFRLKSDLHIHYCYSKNLHILARYEEGFL